MDLSLALTPVVSLIAGILIFVFPRLLAKIVAIYLIAVGVIGLLGAGNFQILQGKNHDAPRCCRLRPVADRLRGQSGYR